VEALGSSHLIYSFAKRSVWDSMTAAGLLAGQTESKKMRFYLGSKFYMCQLIGREPVALGLAPADRQVMRMRMDTWWGCSRLARFGVIDPGWEDLCPFCTDMEMDLPLEVPETTVRAIFECPAWALQREQFLQPAVGDIQARLREVQTRAVAEQRFEYQNLDEEDENLLRGLLGGSPLVMCCRTILLLATGASCGIIPSPSGKNMPKL
jgi:hypothetical protein